MFSFVTADAFDPLLWSGMLVAITLAALGFNVWWERHARHNHRRHGADAVRREPTARGVRQALR